MADRPTLLVVGGTSGIGREIASRAVQRGERVFLTGRDAARTKLIADEVGAIGVAVDLSRPAEVAEHLTAVDTVDHLVIAAIERDQNNCADYNLAGAVNLATLKLVGYTEVIHALLPRMTADASIVLFGGLAKDRPYAGSTTVSTVNGGISTMVHALAVELAPIRVNAIHPSIVGDSPYWSQKPEAVLEGFRSRTPLGRLVSMRDVVGAVAFLLENPSVTGVHLPVDGGWLLM
jgi:NAD(P)-dependent dehydrogenase (short-subunit alcohol dehydrogenase family)